MTLWRAVRDRENAGMDLHDLEFNKPAAGRAQAAAGETGKVIRSSWFVKARLRKHLPRPSAALIRVQV
jgi:hypothetical protein